MSNFLFIKTSYTETKSFNNRLNLSVFLLFFFSVVTLNSCRCIEVKKLDFSDSSSSLDHAALLSYAQNNLPHEGILVQQIDGFAYLKVDDNYVHELFPMLHAQEDYEEPPYFRRSDAPGAHVSVAYENEGVKLKEVGKKFNFKIKDIKEVHPRNKNSYIILTLDAPELEALRKSYGLQPRLKDHEFHISLAKKAHKKPHRQKNKTR
jgi:hypothetical protein